MHSLLKKMGRSLINVHKEARYLLTPGKPCKLLFEHIPKCAGTTISSYLKQNYPDRKMYNIYGRAPSDYVAKFQQLPIQQRHNFDLVQGHLAHRLINFVHPDAIKITLFRHPVDRIISHYYYVLSNPHHYLYPKAAGMNLAEYVSANISLELQNWYIIHFTGRTVREIQQAPLEAIHHAKEVLNENYQLIGFMEQLDDFMNQLQSLAQLPLAFQNRKLNKTIGRPRNSEIPQSTIDLIAEHNQPDIDLYHALQQSQTSQQIPMQPAA